jgi:hypothetical protein
LLKKCRLTTPEIAKKSSDEQFLKASRNWEKSSALALKQIFYFLLILIDHDQDDDDNDDEAEEAPIVIRSRRRRRRVDQASNNRMEALEENVEEESREETVLLFPRLVLDRITLTPTRQLSRRTSVAEQQRPTNNV